MNNFEEVTKKLNHMHKIARDYGVTKLVDDPYLSLAFMSLPVIPELKLTDEGLFDVTQFKPVDIEEDAL
mgnify:FL=1